MPLMAAVETQRKIFVAYPYAFPTDDYRRPFEAVAKAFFVKFEFADEQITNLHVLDKITGMIRTSRLCLFDITTANPNVALELGIAVGYDRDFRLLFNPEVHKAAHPQADLGGLDRLQYGSYADLEEKLTQLLAQVFGVPQEAEQMSTQLEQLRTNIPGIVSQEPGLKISEIADRLGVPTDLAQLLMRPLIADRFDTTGVKRGTRYYPKGTAPRRGGGVRPGAFDI